MGVGDIIQCRRVSGFPCTPLKYEPFCVHLDDLTVPDPCLHLSALLAGQNEGVEGALAVSNISNGPKLYLHTADTGIRKRIRKTHFNLIM